MLAKSAVSANSFLLAISTNASTLAVAADGLRLVCHVCRLCRVCQVFLADMGQNLQNVAIGAQHFHAHRDDEDATGEKMELSCQRAEFVHLCSIRSSGQNLHLSGKKIRGDLAVCEA
jgi:hypothetical protein